MTFKEDMTLDELDAMFDKMVSEEELEVEDVVEEPIAEEEEEELRLDEDTIEEDVTEEVVEEEVDVQPTQQQKEEHAFAQMRIARDEANQKATEYEQELQDMAKALGLEGVNELRAQVEAYRLEKERREKGIPDEAADAYQAVQREKQELDAQRQALAQQEFANREAYVGRIVEDLVTTHSLDVEMVGQKLVQSGISYEELVNSPHPEAYIRGILYEELQQPVSAPKKRVDTKEIKTNVAPTDTKTTNIDKLLEADIEDFLKDRGY